MADTNQSVEAIQRAKVLKAARALIGTKYSKLDCSHMVHKAYEDAGLKYTYMSTESLAGEAAKSVYFKDAGGPRPGDLVLYTGHVGIYDPEGCAETATAECKKLKGEARILSARSGNNLGVEYGRSAWFAGTPKYLRWKEFADD